MNNYSLRVLKRIAVSAALFLFLLFFGRTSFAYANDVNLSPYITDLTIKDVSWHYNEAQKSVEVTKHAPVNLELTAFITNAQWNALSSEGSTVTLYFAPGLGSGYLIQVTDVTIDDVPKEGVKGSLNTSRTQANFILDAPSNHLLRNRENIVIRAKMLATFAEDRTIEGHIKVTVKETDQAWADITYNKYSIEIRKITDTDNSHSLAGVEFQLDRMAYSADHSSGWVKVDCSAMGFESNETFTINAKGNLVTSGTGWMSLVGGFYPGYVYRLKEVSVPPAYTKLDTEFLFAFYHYTERTDKGTLTKIRELNTLYKAFYDEMKVPESARYGNTDGSKGTELSLTITNKKHKPLRLKKINDSGETLKDISFVLSIPASEAKYSKDDYMNISSDWKYDNTKKLIYREFTTGSDGTYDFGPGQVPASGDAYYTLTETVPEGYFGYPGTLEFKFKVKDDGSVVSASSSLKVIADDTMILLQVTNKTSTSTKLSIKKVDESGTVLEGAEFEVYGPEEAATDLTKKLEDDGVLLGYYVKTITTDSSGIASVEGLPYGTYYLIETKAPPAFVRYEGITKITLSKSVTEASYTIVNTRLIIPVTGGSGTLAVVLIGCAVMALAVLAFVSLTVSKRRRAGILNLLLSVLCAAVFAIGAVCMLKPLKAAADAKASHQDVIERYDKSLGEEGTGRESAAFLMEKETRYNELLNRIVYGNGVMAEGSERSDISEVNDAYEDVRLLCENECLGYISIPSIDVRLPIYTQETTDGAFHVRNTSLPTGTKGTHTVLAGHTGMPSAKLFTDLDCLQIGDTFTVTSCGQDMTYAIDQILTIQPDNVEALAIVPDEDYVTLLTCTPYGINSHRLLVRGRRTDGEGAVAMEIGSDGAIAAAAGTTSAVTYSSHWTAHYLRQVLICVAAGLLVIVIYTFYAKENEKRRRRKLHRRAAGLAGGLRTGEIK